MGRIADNIMQNFYNDQQAEMQKNPQAYLDKLLKSGIISKLPNGKYAINGEGNQTKYGTVVKDATTAITRVPPPSKDPYAKPPPGTANQPSVTDPFNYQIPTTPQAVKPDTTSLDYKIKLRDAQIKNFGSADQGLLNEIATLQKSQQTAPPTPTLSQPIVQPIPVQNPSVPVQPTATNPVPPVAAVVPPTAVPQVANPTTGTPTLGPTLPPEAITQALNQLTPTQLATPSSSQTIETPNGGIEAGTNLGGRDEAKLLAEAELQKKLRQQSYDETTASRKKMLSDLSNLLMTQQKAQLQDSLPGIYEDLNARGLLRSSALGDRVSTEQSKLARQTSEQLALQGLSDDNTALGQLGGIEENYLSARDAAIGRRFSLEDYATQLQGSKELGAATTPIAQKGPSAKGGALQGGAQGATAGSAAGPWGAAIGGGLGMILGSQSAGGK